MVISSTSGFQAVFEQMENLKKAARASGMFIVADSDLAFNQPVVRVNVDRSKANDLGINMAALGNTLSTLLGGNYVNRFNLEGRSYQVIPQVPRDLRLTPESIGMRDRWTPCWNSRPGRNAKDSATRRGLRITASRPARGRAWRHRSGVRRCIR